MAVLSFCYEHGIDVFEVYETDSWGELSEATEDVEVTARDPAELRVVLERDGDRLKVTLDDEAQVTDVTEVPD